MVSILSLVSFSCFSLSFLFFFTIRSRLSLRFLLCLTSNNAKCYLSLPSLPFYRHFLSLFLYYLFLLFSLFFLLSFITLFGLSNILCFSLIQYLLLLYLTTFGLADTKFWNILSCRKVFRRTEASLLRGLLLKYGDMILKILIY